ncbi:MAG: hypothetical protein ACJ8BH_16645 [Microvirga sp.]
MTRSPVMAGLSRPSRCGEAQCFTDRDHRDKPGDDVENVRAERRKPKRERESQPGTVIPQRPGSITAAALQWGLSAAPDSHPRGNDNTEGRASNLPHSRTACPVVDDDGESRRRQHFSSA